MERGAKIYVAGHRGLVGSALVRELERQGYAAILTRTHQELDLTDQAGVSEFFRKEKPEYVFLAAAKVGGVMANSTQPADFLYINLQIQNNIIHSSYLNGVRKLLFLGSTCVYPRECPQPMKEEYLLTGPLEPTNEPYAVAKIAGMKLCQSYNRQYGTHYIAVMPTNLYGINDNFDLTTSHVIPALLRKFHEAKVKDTPVTVWGTGSPVREFLWSDDCADACIHLMDHFIPTKEQNERGEIFFNIGTGMSMTIKELVRTVAHVVGFDDEIVWDASKPDGMPKKVLDVSRMQGLGWSPKTGFEEGLRIEYQWYLTHADTQKE